MMNYEPPDELPDLPVAGMQVGDTSLMTPDGVIHLPTCSVWKTTTNQVDPAKCSCGAKFVKRNEFTANKESVG